MRSRPRLRKPALSATLAAALCGAPAAAPALPSVGAKDGARPRVAEIVPATRVVAPPATAFTTSWPRVAPCPNPRWLNVAGYHGGTLFWSNASGAKQVSSGQELATESLILPPNLGAGGLDRLWVASGPIIEGVYLDCSANDDAGSEHALEWNLSPSKQVFEVTARYRAPRRPRARRVGRWIDAPVRAEPSKPSDFAPFVSRITWPGKPAEAVAAESVRFTRDMLFDLRELIAVACAGRRCAEVMQGFSLAALEAARVSRAVYERLDQQRADVQPFGHKYEWRVSANGARAQVGCDVTSSYQILCELALTTATGQRLNYDAWYSKIELVAPSGVVEFSTDRGGTRVTISGAPLALQAARDMRGSK